MNAIRLGLIGTGRMGSAMARRLLSQGVSLWVCNRDSKKALPLGELGAHVEADPGRMLGQVDVVLAVLRDGSASKEVLLGSCMDWQNRCLIQMATISPSESLELERRVMAGGGEYLEAPVLGSVPQALAGELIIMAGGERDLFEKLHPLLRILSSRDCLHIGSVGRAAAMKLAFNQLIVSLTTAFAASHAYLKKNDVSVALFMDLLRRSALYAPTFDKKLPLMERRDFDSANFTLENMHKDVALIEAEFFQNGIAARPIRAVREIIERAVAKGLGEKDYSVLYEAIFGGDDPVG